MIDKNKGFTIILLMTIGIALPPKNLIFDPWRNSSRLLLIKPGAQQMSEGIHNILPPQTEDDRRVKVFKDGTGEIKDPYNHCVYPLNKEGDHFILWDRRDAPLKLRALGVVFYEKGKNPER